MPSYRIFRLRDSQRAQFRQLPHVSGSARLKLKDYVEAGTLEAATPYAAWKQSLDGEAPLAVGDALVEESGQLLVMKFVGFEPAEWVVPEMKVDTLPVAAGVPA
jgi:hypothetical protein